MKLCWFYQKLISSAVSGKEPAPQWMARHLGACPDCRQFQQEQTRLSTVLAKESSPDLIVFPPYLHSKIMSRVQSVTCSSEARLPAGRWIRTLLIPALGAIGVMVVLMRMPERPKPAVLGVNARPVLNLEQLIPHADPAQLLAWTERVDEPLETELDAVVSDAKSALNSLTANFLPAQRTAQAP